MTATSVSIDLSGPFFQRDPGKTLRRNITKMVQGLAEEGERSARAAFQSGEGGRRPISRLGGRVSEHIIGRTRSLSGRQWRASAVISVNNSGLSAREGVALMAAASVVEGRTHIFRGLARIVRQSRAVLYADLTKGLE